MGVLKELKAGNVSGNDLVALVNRDRGRFPIGRGTLPQQYDTPTLPTFVIRIDSNATGGGRYEGTLMCPSVSAANTGALAMPEGMTAGDAVLVENMPEDGSTGHRLKADGSIYVLGTFGGYSSEVTSRAVFASYAESNGSNDSLFSLFPVNVTQTGGAAGSDSAACSFTYTVNNLDSDQLGTAMSPTWAREAKGKKVAATHGTGYYNAGGTFVLYQVDEVDDVVACTP